MVHSTSGNCVKVVLIKKELKEWQWLSQQKMRNIKYDLSMLCEDTDGEKKKFLEIGVDESEENNEDTYYNIDSDDDNVSSDFEDESDN